MTDITELAMREKFEAWWERTQHNGNPPRFGWECWRDGEGYKVDDDESELDGMWEAWKAASAELVEALEKAQQRIGKLEKKITDHKRMNQEMAKAMLTPNDSDVAGMEIAALRQRIAELESRTVTVKLPHRNLGHPKLFLLCPFPYYDAEDMEKALAAAGIKWEAE
uniref:hypothetical protein n=1 Tax=Klebsiella quasipneumoniae TaxID=1463165 RepID=UPI001033C118|nr:hypothetical protein [Klebsiella quasipneumoniae]